MTEGRMRAFESRRSVMVALIVVAAGTSIAACGNHGNTSSHQQKVPPLTQDQLVAKGRTIFQSTCATCHGTTLHGTSMAP